MSLKKSLERGNQELTYNYIKQANTTRKPYVTTTTNKKNKKRKVNKTGYHRTGITIKKKRN